MLQIVSREAIAAVSSLVGPERPGPIVVAHIAHMGHGYVVVDRLPEPGVLVAVSGRNVSAAGNPELLGLEDAREHLRGFVDAPASFEQLLRSAFDSVTVWPRIVHALESPPNEVVAPNARRLQAS
ncbi:MAG: hypothetical protein ICV72_10945, partial [Aldersonia sp.]|nr:hypothetical protein [Aldersonia sp.]